MGSKMFDDHFPRGILGGMGLTTANFPQRKLQGAVPWGLAAAIVAHHAVLKGLDWIGVFNVRLVMAVLGPSDVMMAQQQRGCSYRFRPLPKGLVSELSTRSRFVKEATGLEGELGERLGPYFHRPSQDQLPSPM